MQNKGAIKFLAIALAVVCLYQLSFTFFTSRVESKAKKFAMNEEVLQQAKTLAKGDVLREQDILDSLKNVRERSYLDSMSSQVIYNILIRKYTYKECKDREINLGLDLKGGMNVTMEVSVVDLIRAMSNNSKDATFNKAITNAIEKQKNSQDDFVTIFYNEFKALDANAKLAAIFGTVELKEKINPNSTNDEVIKVIRDEADAAIDRTFNILRTRIDKFGVTQPNIQKLQTAGRILVELPGIKEPERVRKLLQNTARLEFWETYEFTEVYPFLENINAKLATILNATADSTSTDSTKNIVVADKKDKKTVAENKKDKKAVDSAKVSSDTSALLNQVSNDTTKAKGNEQQNFEEYAKKNPLYAYMRPNFVQDEKGQYYPSKGPAIGTVDVKDTARVMSMLNIPAIKYSLPRNLRLLWTNKAVDKEGKFVQLIAIKVTSRDGSASLGGEVVVDARQDYGQNNSNEISMSMNSEGARIWKRLTSQNIGKSIAIVLDNYVYSFPTVNGEIPNGRSSITGNFTLEEAKDLANVLKAGKLPAPAHIVEEAVVGPSLGKEAIDSGILSFIVAFIMVLLYMIFYYNRAGLVANVALIVNVFFIFGVMASLGAVLTLPGIAGIVLTLGMAVDSNVIIYERIREEIRAGKGLKLAISDGYKHAYSAIIDGNLTTIITAIILYIFGSGPIQGFATTLIIGILTSLFTSILISRIIFEWMIGKNMNISLGNKMTMNAFTKVNIDFIKIRKKLYIASTLFILIGIGSLFMRGLNFSVDFTGGRTYIVRFDQDVKSAEIRKALTTTLEEAPEVKTFGNNFQVKITTKYIIDNNTAAGDSIVEAKIYEGVKSYFKNPINAKDFSTSNETIGILSSQKVGPTIADDIKQQAVWALLFALLGIFIYIAFRFKKWQYGLGGIVSLFHDSLVVISCYSLFWGILPFSLEIDQAFIAAILTVIGYSINDSVIIFDRIREYNILYPKRPLDVNINGAINSTLGRTFNTAGTTLVTLLVIFFFGGDVIRGFIFALLVGIGVGTYSSIFNATPLAYDFIKMSERRRLKKEQQLNKK